MELHAGDVAIPRAVSGGLQFFKKSVIFSNLALQYRERYQEGYNATVHKAIYQPNDEGCNTASGIRRATIKGWSSPIFVFSSHCCNTASGIRRATIKVLYQDMSYQPDRVAIPRAVSGGLQ